MAFLPVKSRQLPAVSFGSPTFLSLMPAKPPQQLYFPAAMLPLSAATYKLVTVPSKPYWSSVCLMSRSKGDEKVDENDMEPLFIVILCLMAIALIIGFSEFGKKRKENTMEEVERAFESFLNFTFGRNEAETGRRKTCCNGAEAGRRERETGGGDESSRSRQAEKPIENDLKYEKIDTDTAIEILIGVVRTVEFSKKGPKIENAEKIVKELESILNLIVMDRKPKWQVKELLNQVLSINFDHFV